MLKLGLTGGIASGKSAVASILRELGFPVLDADSLSHQLMEPGQPAHDEIIREFGADFAEGSGRIDRGKLAAVVFAHPAKLARLNAILHPRVEQAMLDQFDAWQRSGLRDVAFVEANDSIIRFYFPRQGTVQPGDKEMIFHFEIQDTVVDAKFTLKDMVFKGKASL